MAKANLLDTSTTNFIDLIGNGRTYRVPPYQRDYSWGEEQWEDLWSDLQELVAAPDGPPHYMGALVVSPRSDREFEIIDGQQRIATLSRLEQDASGRACDPETDPGTVEHILPENPTEGWAENIPIGRWPEAISRLGNLTLLEPALNRALGNALFPEKLVAYTTSRYALTKHISASHPQEWTLDQLEVRQRRLADRAVHLWRADFD